MELLISLYTGAKREVTKRGVFPEEREKEILIQSGEGFRKKELSAF